MNELFCGIDAGVRSSSICILSREKELVRRWDGKTSEIADVLREYGERLCCVVETAPLAESLCRMVEGIGGRIEIIDSRHTKALLHGKKKTDRIDARTLAELALLGWYKVIYRKDGVARELRTILGARAATVSSATTIKNTIRGFLRAHGIVLPMGGDGVKFTCAVNAALPQLPTNVQGALKDLLEIWESTHQRQYRAYRDLARMARKNEAARRLMTVPGVGPATALCFIATIATHERFKSPKQVSSYLGLAPRVYQSGETNYHGTITKRGDKLMRWLMVEAASSMLTRTRTSFPLRDWALRLAEKKGVAKAKVALARRLAELLFVLWRKEVCFQMPAM